MCIALGAAAIIFGLSTCHSDQCEILMSNGSVDADDRDSDRAGVGCHPLDDRDRRGIGRIANTSYIEDAAVGLLRSVQVGQRHRNLVVDDGLARTAS